MFGIVSMIFLVELFYGNESSSKKKPTFNPYLLGEPKITFLTRSLRDCPWEPKEVAYVSLVKLS